MDDARRELKKLEDATDRQRVLDELCRRVLRPFVGRTITPYVLEQATLCMEQAIGDAIRAGTYVLPDGLKLGSIELGPDMRLKVFFTKAESAIVDPGPRDRFEAVMAEIDDMLKEESK